MSSDTHIDGYKLHHIPGSKHYTENIRDVLEEIIDAKDDKESKELAQKAIDILDNWDQCTCDSCCAMYCYS